VRTYIERCKEVNGLINAIVQDRYDDAIKEAKAVDAIIEKCTDVEKIKITQPFLGVPFTTKESNRVKGKRIPLKYFGFSISKLFIKKFVK
jgi:fatty acid amide hydrolase 2